MKVMRIRLWMALDTKNSAVSKRPLCTAQNPNYVMLSIQSGSITSTLGPTQYCSHKVANDQRFMVSGAKILP